MLDGLVVLAIFVILLITAPIKAVYKAYKKKQGK